MKATTATICLGVLLAAGLARADTVTLSHGSIMRGDVKAVTMRVKGKDSSFERGKIASILLAPGTTAADVLTTTDGKKLTGRVVNVAIKTIGGLMTFDRKRIASIQLTGGAPDGGKEPIRPKTPEYADKIMLKMGHTVDAVVMQVMFAEGRSPRRHMRSKLKATELGKNGTDVLVMSDGSKLRGRLESVRARLSVGVVDFSRSEVVLVTLGRATTDNPGPSAHGLPKPTARQEATLAENRAMKDEYAAKVAEQKDGALARIRDNYVTVQSMVKEHIEGQESLARRARDRANTAKRYVDTMRADMEKAPSYRKAMYETRIAIAQNRYNQAAETYRRANEKLTKARNISAAVERDRSAEERDFTAWAGRQMAALSRACTKNNFLLLAGVPLGKDQMTRAYDAAVERAPEVKPAPKWRKYLDE